MKTVHEGALPSPPLVQEVLFLFKVIPKRSGIRKYVLRSR